MTASNQFQPVYFFMNGYTSPYAGYGPVYTILNLTAHTATLFQSGNNPDAEVWEMINLQKQNWQKFKFNLSVGFFAGHGSF